MSDSVVQHCCPMQFGWEKLCLKCIGFVFHQKIISQSVMLLKNVQAQWKRINCKQSTRWQHLSQLKAIAFLLENYFVRC